MITELNCKEEFISLLSSKEYTLIVYGAGRWGRKIALGEFNEICDSCNINEEIKYFCDKSPALPDNYYGIKILKPKEMEKINNQLLIFVCTGINEKHFTQVKNDVIQELRKLNINASIYNINDMFTINKTNGTVHFGHNFWVFDLFKFMRNTPDYYKKIYRQATKEPSKYINELLDERQYAVNSIIRNSKDYSLVDFQGKYFNTVNGKRVTIPSIKASNCIYFYGDSRVMSVFTEDQHTICSFLQKNINSDFLVVNCGIPRKNSERMLFQLMNTELKEGDIVFWACNYMYTHNEMDIIHPVECIIKADQYCKKKNVEFFFFGLPSINEVYQKTEVENYILDHYDISDLSDHSNVKKYFEQMLLAKGIKYYDLSNIFNSIRPQNYQEYFVDADHYGPDGNELIADWLADLIRVNKSYSSKLESEKVSNIINKRAKDFEMELTKLNYDSEVDNYISNLKDKYGTIVSGADSVGGIVMNCNPFTYGHRYLIEYASKQVDVLFIFVLEENRSEYTFEERFYLVKENTKDLKNVHVIKSGKFIISSLTFPEYFEKGSNPSVNIDASKDLMLFSERIAPALKIKKRFVGQEPYCVVTNAYNIQMKNILSEKGIEVIEIPRKDIGGTAISASEVRRRINAGELEGVKELVPEYTYNLICKKFGFQKI
ncbi:MAG: hypothetical protein PHF63_02830 [Herbinix sp.]|nr:hypothetical protein [Herbinix sp.]